MLYEIESVRRFTGIGLNKVPDETTILNFRHLLESVMDWDRCCLRASRTIWQKKV